MHIASVVGTAAFFASVLAQTPADTQPSTDIKLGVEYASVSVEPDVQLPRNAVLTVPTISSDTTYPDTYMLFLIDLSIPTSFFPANETASLTPGLGSNRTTRLHWWAGNITQTSTNTFTNSSPALAEYGGPNPPLGDIPHTYTFYLFSQPEGYVPPAKALDGAYTAASASARMNFSALAIADVVGAPLAATFFRTENPNNTVNGTAAITGSGSNVSVAASATPSSFEGAAGTVSVRASVAMAVVGAMAFATL